MEIGKYKQAMSHLLNQNATLKTFVINPEAKLIDNDPPSLVETFANGGRVGFKNAGLAINELPTDVPHYKGSRLETFKKGLKTLTEWKKNPTAYNWIKAFGYKSESGQNKQTEFAKDLRDYIKGKLTKQTTKELFDRLEVKNYLKNNINDIKDLDKSLIEKRQSAGTQARAESQLAASAERIEPINEQFKKNPNIGLEELTKNIYGKEFTKVDDIEKLKLATQVSDDVAKYLEALKGIRGGVSGLPTGDKLKKITNVIESNTPGYRFREGVLRNYKFNVADEARGFDFNYTQNLRDKITEGAKRVVDESVGLSATFKNAPGYLESTQFLKQATNEIKSKQIDKPFSEAFSAALEGDISKVADYNKQALKFKTKYPNVDVPFIKYGDKLSDVKKYVKNFDDFSDASKENILNIAKERGIVVKTDSLPLPVLVDKYSEAMESKGLDRSSKLKAIGLSPRGHSLNVDVIPGLGALSETQAANTAGKLALGVSRNTGAPINAVLGAFLNAPELREQGFGRLDAALLGAGKGMTQDLLNFGADVLKAPQALYKTFKEDPNTKKVRWEQFLENLGPNYFSFYDKMTDKASERLSTKEYIDNLAQLEYEKELQKVMPAPSISETEVFDTDQYLNEELFKKKYREKLFKQFPEFKDEYNYVNKEPAITQKGVLNFNVEDLTQPQELAKGGRVGYADGSGPKFTRRGALGLLGALAATPLVKSLTKGEKFLEESKVAKVAKRIPKAAGMPEWFPSLVARIEKEGKDISIPVKNLEDMIVTKKLEIKVPGKKDPEIITMHKHPDGSIQIEANVSGGAFDSPFELHYTPPKSDIDLTTGKAINEPGDFNVLENRPISTARSHHDADYEIDYGYVSHQDAISDIERVEKIATGKRIHPKKVEERTAARKYVEDNPYEDIVNRYGEVDVGDWWEQ